MPVTITSPPSRVLAAAVGLSLIAASGRVRGDAESCANASEQGQLLRIGGKLVEARAQIAACAASSCPALVREDCEKWLVELDAAIPTVVVSARSAAGKDVVDVRVTVDGKVLLERLDGQPRAVDPGPHVFRYEPRGGVPVEERVVITAGEKNRLLSVKLPAPEAPPPPPGNGPPLGTWILGGVAVGALGSFAWFGLRSSNGYASLERDCAPRCSEDRIARVRTDGIIADVSLGVAIVSVGVATWLWVSAPAARAPAIAVGVAPTTGGGFGAVTAVF